ncbi:hypothetical protein BJF79_14630 [Actinomadura sp. CNU-125]|nr:hypothetical protein BJF79_14630 [Actinomadura sp. CNU-125]
MGSVFFGADDPRGVTAGAGAGGGVGGGGVSVSACGPASGATYSPYVGSDVARCTGVTARDEPSGPFPSVNATTAASAARTPAIAAHLLRGPPARP